MVKVLIVDDSAIVRKLLSRHLGRYDDIDIVGTAVDPYDAREKIINLKPDVLTLDIEMPRMDGISFLKRLMTYYPIPTVMVSSLTREGCETTLEALDIGAVDFVAKPSAGSLGDVDELVDELYCKIIAASMANVKRLGKVGHIPNTERKNPTSSRDIAIKNKSNKIIALGASTGGTEALKEVLSQMPSNAPGIVIAQHMPEIFTKYLAERLNSLSSIEVYEAEDGMAVRPGTALIAPGNYHMELKINGPNYYVKTSQGAKVNNHRPSVDLLFNSVAISAGNNAIGVIMTGMGADGAKGLWDMKRAGAKTIAQDEESCVVFGMPKEAIKLGAAGRVVGLAEIPSAILSMLNSG